MENADKIATIKQWNQTPCGTGDYLAHLTPDSLEYFDNIRHSRYEITDRWMKKTIDFDMAHDKKLLEIGHGIGSDLLTFAEHGAEVYGVDITPKHHQMAKKNFELHHKTADLRLCDAAHLPFPDHFFDVVYSCGVLHHTPDTIRCIGEAYRVLKPGGTFILALYHTYSVFLIAGVLLRHGLSQGKLFKLGYKGLLSTIEHGADGINIKPLVKTYSKNQVALMLSDFSDVTLKIAHLDRRQFSFLGKIIPQKIINFLEPYLGWYVVAFAQK